MEDSQEAVENASQTNYEHNLVQASSTGDDDSQQEIIQNSENNLVYTVLGSKKQAQGGKQSNADYVQVIDNFIQ